MAGNAVIGALRVVLGMDSVSLEKGAKDARASLQKFNDQLSVAGAAAAAAFTVAMGGVVFAINKSLDEADKMGKLAQSVGLPVEELSKLKHAADLSDVSIEEFGKALVKLSKNMSDVAGGATGPAAEAFRKMGVSATDANGQLKSSGAVLEEIADKFEGYKDGAAKSAIAVALFGKAGANMIPMLNAGASGLKEAKQEAEEFGLVIDKKTAIAAETFNDNMTRLHRVLDGITTQIAAYLAPDLANLSVAMVQFSKDGNVVKGAVEGIQTAVMFVAREFALFAVGLQGFGAQAVAFKDLMASLTTFDSGAISSAWQKLQTAAADTDKQFAEVNKRFDEMKITAASAGTALLTYLQSPIAGMVYDFRGLQKEVLALGEGFLKTAAPVLGAKTAIQSYIDGVKKSTEGTLAEAASVGMATGAKERLKVVAEGLQVAIANDISQTAALKLKLDEVAIAAGNAALKLAGMNLIQQAKEPHELYRQELENNRLAVEAAGGSLEQLAAVNEKTAQKFGMTWQQAVPSIAGSFAEIASSFGKENAKMAKAAQVLGAVQALIATMVGSAESLKLGGWVGIAAAAAVAAKGFALVAAIKSQSVPAMSTGGAITVPGGIGGGDRVRAMVDLEPGEQLDVWRPGEGNADPRRGANAPQPQIVSMKFSDPFSREFWRRGIEQINELTRDGYRLEVAG
jgi:hypothetical protein